MVRAVPENSLWHHDNHHLYCRRCRTPLHDPISQQVLEETGLVVKSADEVWDYIESEQNLQGNPLQLWAKPRGADDFRGKGKVNELRRRPVQEDSIFAAALDDVRSGLTKYPLTGIASKGISFTGPGGQTLLERYHAAETGYTGDRPSVNALRNYVTSNRIKGWNTTSDHGLTLTSKMYGGSEDTPTWACPVGNILKDVEGSTCEGCYVDSIQHMRYDSGERHRTRNLLGMQNPLKYAAALHHQIGLHDDGEGKHHLRINAAGDIQNEHHLAMLMDMARAYPHKKFWIPTREWKAVDRYMKAFADPSQAIPDNVSLRLSQLMRKTAPHEHSLMTKLGQHPNITYSTVNASHKGSHPDEVWSCPAAGQKLDEGTCAHHHCDACWDPSIKWVDYSGHGSAVMHNELSPEERMMAANTKLRTNIRRTQRIQERGTPGGRMPLPMMPESMDDLPSL